MSDALTIAERIVAEVEKPRARPTIGELEAILARNDETPVTINADGSIGVGKDERLILARAVIATRSLFWEYIAAARKAHDRFEEEGKYGRADRCRIEIRTAETLLKKIEK